MTVSTARRALLALAATAVLAGPALPQSNPTIKFVVPFPAGGTADILPRIVAEKLRSNYPGGVVVENKAGAGGNIGGDYVARSEPDGTTFLVSPPGPIAINHHLYKSMTFDPTKWVPVTVLATVPNVLAVSTKLPVTDVASLVAYLKANPGKVSYASQGNGSTSHLTASLFMDVTGTKMIHIPYKGTAPALVDLVGGTVDVFFDNISSSANYHNTGKLRILAVADEKRSPLLPFFSIVAPAGTPAAAAANLQKAVAAALALPDVRQKFIDQGAEPRGWSPEQTGSFIRRESDKWNKVIKSAGVIVE
jgi:tripartite-type tricarboxylate transporter receptor subunit TctC